MDLKTFFGAGTIRRLVRPDDREHVQQEPEVQGAGVRGSRGGYRRPGRVQHLPHPVQRRYRRLHTRLLHRQREELRGGSGQSDHEPVFRIRIRISTFLKSWVRIRLKT